MYPRFVTIGTSRDRVARDLDPALLRTGLPKPRVEESTFTWYADLEIVRRYV